MNTEKICFLIAPIGEEYSIERRKLEGIIKILERVFEGSEYKVIAANQISESGSIPSQIIKLLKDSELVVANLTGLNGNVMYELALRHVFRKHVIIIAEENTKTPFDIYTERIIFFKDSFQGYDNFINELKASIELCNKLPNVDNPVTRAFVQNIDGNEKSSQFRDVVLEELNKKNFIYPLKTLIDSHNVSLTNGTEIIVPTIIETETELLIPYITATKSTGTFARGLTKVQTDVENISKIRNEIAINKQKKIRGIMILDSNFMEDHKHSKGVEILHFHFGKRKFIIKPIDLTKKPTNIESNTETLDKDKD